MIEEVIDLSGLSIDSDGAFLICADTFTLAPIASADLIVEGAVNLENSDNITIVLVTNFTGIWIKIWTPTTTAPWMPRRGSASLTPLAP